MTARTRAAVLMVFLGLTTAGCGDAPEDAGSGGAGCGGDRPSPPASQVTSLDVEPQLRPGALTLTARFTPLTSDTSMHVEFVIRGPVRSYRADVFVPIGETEPDVFMARVPRRQRQHVPCNGMVAEMSVDTGCGGLDAGLDPRAGTASLVVPARCLGRPDRIRIGAAVHVTPGQRIETVEWPQGVSTTDTLGPLTDWIDWPT